MEELNLLYRDFIHFSTLHSYYSHIPLEGRKYYFYKKKGLQPRLSNGKVNDIDVYHWHFTSVSIYNGDNNIKKYTVTY